MNAATAAATLRLTFTRFVNFAAATKSEHTLALDELEALIRTTTAPAKASLPWLKLARFGDQRTEHDSLRHDANVLATTGIEADYDGEEIAFDQAVATLERVGLLALVYTSPSHTAERPRWRVLCPTSQALPPPERARLVSRLNGVFGGIFSTESWTLSQAYYFGSVGGNAAHRVTLLDGIPIDERDDLDAGAIGKPGTKPSGGGGTGPSHGPLDEDALLDEIRSGASYHTAAVRLLGKWAASGVAYLDARTRLRVAMEEVPEPERDDRWHRRFADLDRCLADIYGKEAKARDEAETEGDRGLVSEDSVALALAHTYATTLRFCHHSGRWYRWTGSIWQRDETQIGLAIARELARMRAAPLDAKLRKSTGRAAFAAGVERLAQADRRIAVTSAAWDQDPWLLGTPGGTVDLRDGMLRPASPEDHITRATAVGPALAADCPVWLGFLDQACGGDADLLHFLQRWFGYCLTGLTREHALLFVYGPGGNGKGVLLNTIAGILGSYASVAAMETFAASKGDRHPTDIAMLHGARLVVSTETEEGRPWAEARIKALTGGDPVTARFMRRDFFTFTPSFKLNVSGNHKPALRNVDDAARRRFNVVPFMHRPEQPDTELSEKLKAEWPAILRWLIDGCLEWQRVGLQRPRVVTDATAEYFAEQDLVAQWVEECCIRDATLTSRNDILFASWRGFVTERGEYPQSVRSFGDMLERLGFERVKDYGGMRGRGFRGIGLRPDQDPRAGQEGNR